MNLLIHRDGQQFGPYTLEQARAFVADGSLLSTDLAWPDGAKDWVPLAEVLKATPAPIRKRSRGKIIAFTLLGGFGVLLVMWGAWRIHLASQVSARFAAVKAAGYPTNPAELDAWYAAVPEQENAALLVIQATNLLAKPPPGDSKNYEVLKMLPRTAPLPPELRSAYTAELDASRAGMVLLHQAAQLTNSRYPVDFSVGFLVKLTHLSEVKHAANLLRKEALLATEGARPSTTASESLIACLGLGRTLKAEPSLISQLVREAVDYMAAEALQRTLNRTAFTDAQLTSLAAAFADADDPTTFARALAGERAGILPYFRMSRADASRLADASDGSEVALSGGPPIMGFTGFFERDLRFYLTAMETNIALLNLPAPQSLIYTNVSDAFCLEARRKYCIFSALLLPAYGKLAIKAADTSARLRVASAALAVERFRVAHQNQLPDSLAALVPAYLPSVPRDPWDGQPLRFKRLAKGYVVYSIGSDAKDDGGLEQAWDEKGKRVSGPFDITFTVER